MTREYIALVEGRLESRSGTIDAPLGRDRRRRTRRAVRGAGEREARTHFEVIEALPADTLVRARLETGRTHQIRVHFAAIKHPVAGDPEYGSAGPPRPRAPVPARRAPGVRAPGHGRSAQLRLSRSRRPGEAALASEPADG